MTIDEYRDWLSRQPPVNLTESDLLEAWEFCLKYGPTNSWSGSMGQASSIIRGLLIDRGLREELDQK